jgi:hypothetical protein
VPLGRLRWDANTGHKTVPPRERAESILKARDDVRRANAILYLALQKRPR